MRALIVYDSQYGNTEHIASAIASSLGHYESVQVLPVDQAAGIDLTGVKLLIVGGPTQRHGMSEHLHSWLEGLPPDSLRGIVAAAFDTRYHIPKLFSGSAAQGIAKALKRLGAEMLLPPESFFVVESEGPLADGEVERAERWGLLTPAGVKEE